jgi:hypothetical protein
MGGGGGQLVKSLTHKEEELGSISGGVLKNL